MGSESSHTALLKGSSVSQREQTGVAGRALYSSFSFFKAFIIPRACRGAAVVRKRGLKRGKLNKVETQRGREIKNGGEGRRTMASGWEKKEKKEKKKSSAVCFLFSLSIRFNLINGANAEVVGRSSLYLIGVRWHRSRRITASPDATFTGYFLMMSCKPSHVSLSVCRGRFAGGNGCLFKERRCARRFRSQSLWMLYNVWETN